MFPPIKDLINEIPQELKPLLKHMGFIIIRPDAIAKGYEKDIISDLEEKGLYVVGFKYQFIDERQIEEVYRFTQIKLLSQNVRPVWWLTREMYRQSPALILILGTESLNGFEDCARYIKYIKGPANPALTNKNHLRYKYRAMNILLCTIHSSDDYQHALRESRIFFNHTEIINCLNYIDDLSMKIKPNPHFYLERSVERWYGKTRRTENSFFDVLIKIKIRILANLIELEKKGLKVRVLRDLYQRMGEIIELNGSYIQESREMHILLDEELRILMEFENSTASEKKLMEPLNIEVEVIDKNMLIRCLLLLADYKNYDMINFLNFKKTMERNLIVFDDWESIVLETSFIFHEIQLKSFYENSASVT